MSRPRQSTHALAGNLLLAAIIFLAVALVGPWAALWGTLDQPWPGTPDPSQGVHVRTKVPNPEPNQTLR